MGQIWAWNVRYLRGREEELVEEMVKYRLEVVGVSMRKLKGNGARAVGEGMYVVFLEFRRGERRLEWLCFFQRR